jgi:uncharacterized protein
MADEILVRDVVLLAYKAFGGTIHGRTMLQKRIYFLSVYLGENLGYEAHYYGPYSAEVATINAEMKSVGYLLETPLGYGVDERGFELARYDYQLTEAGLKLADKRAAARPDLWKKIERASQSLAEGGSLNYMELSIAAKAYYVLTQLNQIATLDDIAEVLPRFGWSVSNAELEKAATFLRLTGLVKPAQAKAERMR